MTPIHFGELVHIARWSKAAYPAEFTWRGRRHVVRAVEDYRVQSNGGGSPGASRRLFQLRTASGMRCLLSEDEHRGLWRLEGILGS